MLALRLIERKRDGGHIEPGEWRALANAYAAGHVPDYQMAAFLMACFLRGLDRGETHALTDAMLRSGDTLDLAYLNRPRIDKHSTGGVGDKVSIVLAPLISSIGITVPMMSGRGLGHTGGTLDMLRTLNLRRLFDALDWFLLSRGRLCFGSPACVALGRPELCLIGRHLQLLLLLLNGAAR